MGVPEPTQPRIDGNAALNSELSTAKRQRLCLKLRRVLDRAANGELKNTTIILIEFLSLKNASGREKETFKTLKEFVSKLPSEQKKILLEVLKAKNLTEDIQQFLSEESSPKSSQAGKPAYEAELLKRTEVAWLKFQSKSSPEKAIINQRLVKAGVPKPKEISPEKLLGLCHDLIIFEFSQLEIAKELIVIKTDLEWHRLNDKLAGKERAAANPQRKAPVVSQSARGSSLTQSDAPLYPEVAEAALRAWNNQDLPAKVESFLREKRMIEIDNVQPEQLKAIGHELTTRFLADKAEIEGALKELGVADPKKATARVLLDNASALAKKLPGNSLVTRLNTFQIDRVSKFILSPPDTQIAKVPLQGQLVEIPAWRILSDLRALANNPHVSQVEFINEVIEQSTVMFDRILPKNIEVQASFIEVNGEVLFSEQTFTKEYATAMEQFTSQFGLKFEALNRKYHNQKIPKDVYERRLERLRQEFSAQRIKLLGENSFEIKLPQISAGERSFDIKLRFFVSQPAGNLSNRQVKYYQHQLHQITESFIKNNVSLEQSLRDALLPRKAHSREWAIFKLERLKQFYINQGKRVSMGIFDADYFKNFNAGGNYLLGDDAISILNLTAERAVRVRDQVELIRNGGDEVSILFVGPDLIGARAAVLRINKVLALVTSVPLTEKLSSQHPAVKRLAKEMSISDKELVSLIRTAKDVRGKIRTRIEAGKFRSIKSAAQFTEVFCQPRLVKDVAKVGEGISLERGRLKITVDTGGRLTVRNGSQSYKTEQLKFGERYKISVFGKDYVIVAGKGTGSFTVYHEVSGLRISGGVGRTIEEATAAQMEAKTVGRGVVLIAEESAENAGSVKKTRPAIPEVNTTLYERFGIAENMNKVWSELQRSQREGSLMLEHEAIEVYQLIYEQTFGKEVELKIVQELKDPGRSIRIGGQVYEVQVNSTDPLLESAAREFTALIQQAEKARQHLHIINNAGRVDPRTGLANMTAAQENIAKMLEQVKAQGKGEVQVHFYDMNDFKGINALYQNYGASDSLIEVIAEAYKLAAADLLKGDYTFARLMGDEFLVAGRELTPESLMKMNRVLEIMLGVDPGADPAKLQKLVLDGEDRITLQSGEKFQVSQEMVQIIEKVRAQVVEKIQLGEVEGFNYERLRKAIITPRKGRNGQVAGGIRFSGGTAVVSVEQLAGADGPKLEKIAQMAVEQAGQHADAAKLQRKAENGIHEIKTEGFKFKESKNEAPLERATEEKVGETAIKIKLKPIRRVRAKASKFTQSVRELASKMEVRAKDLQQILTAEGMKGISDRLAKKLVPEKIQTWLKTREAQKMLRLTTDPKYAEQLQRIKAGNKVLGSHGAGLIVGLATLFGAEKLADVLGIKNPVERFVFVVGLSHTANYTTLKLFERGGLQKAYEAFLASSKTVFARNTALATRFAIPGRPLGAFSVNLVRGLAEMAVVSNILRELGIDGHANTIGSFVVPTAVRAGMGYAVARTGGAIAESLVFKGLRFGGRALGMVATVAFIGDTTMSFLNGDYRASVQQRVIDKLKKEGYYDPSLIMGTFERIFTPTGHRERIVDQGEHVNVSRGYVDRLKWDVLAQDRELSFNLRKELAGMFSPFAASAEGRKQIAEFLAPIKWGSIVVGERTIFNHRSGTAYDVPITVSAEKVYEFALEYLQKNKINSFIDEKVIAAVMEEFDIKTKQDYLAIMPKIERKIIQNQFATLYFLDPQGYNKLDMQKGYNDLNADIRRMFNDDGELKDDQVGEFIRWVRAHQ